MEKLFLLHSIKENDSYMLGENTIPAESLTKEQVKYYNWRFAEGNKIHSATCELCGSKKSDYTNPNFNLKKRSYDISITYDGYTIVSQRLRDLFLRNNIIGADFHSISNELPFYILRSENILHLEESKMPQIRKTNYCELCKEYASIVGPLPISFQEKTGDLSYHIFRSDLEFGSSHEKRPLLFVSDQLAEKMKVEKLTGCDFKSI